MCFVFFKYSGWNIWITGIFREQCVSSSACEWNKWSVFMVNLQLSPERQLIIFKTLYFRRPVVFYSSAAKLLRVLVFFFLLLDFFQHDTAYINAAQQLTKPEYNNLWPPLWYTQQQHFKQRIYQMAATNSQVAKRSRGDSGISAAGFLRTRGDGLQLG